MRIHSEVQVWKNRLGTGSRSYMDLAAAQRATLKRKGLSVGLVL